MRALAASAVLLGLCRPAVADEAAMYVKSMCTDFAQIGATTANPGAFILPDAKLDAVVGAFCSCVAANEPAHLLGLYFTSTAWEEIFDGASSVGQYIRPNMDFSAAYVSHYAPCADLVDQAALEHLIYGPGFVRSCQDSDGGAVPAVAGALTGPGMPVLRFLRIAYDLTGQFLNPAAAAGPTIDTCLSGGLLQEAFCVGPRASVADIECPGGCSDGVCKDKLAQGAACSVDANCESGHCADGVCCDRACDGGCEACSAAFNGGVDGTCGPVPLAQDPRDDCEPAEGVCGQDGTCDGQGGCRVGAAGTLCGPATCSAAGEAAGPSSCDGKGACVAPAPDGVCAVDGPPVVEEAPPEAAAEGCQATSARPGVAWTVLGLLAALVLALRGRRTGS